MSEDREERIRQRAYRLWEDDGSPEGRAEEYWSRAVAQVEAETADTDEPAADQASKRRSAGDPLQEPGDLAPAEAARDKRRR